MNSRRKKIYILLEKNIRKIQKTYLAVVIVAFTAIFNALPTFAADFGTSIFATGTKNLFTDIGKYLIILAPIAGAAVGVYFFIRRGAADEMDQKKWNDRIKTTVVSTLGAVLIGTLIVLIASYYGKSVTTGID